MAPSPGYAARAALTLAAALLVTACQGAPSPPTTTGSTPAGSAGSTAGATNASAPSAPAGAGSASTGGSSGIPTGSAAAPTGTARPAPSSAGTPSRAGATTGSPGTGGYRLVQKPLPYPQQRRDQMAAYAGRHYGISSAVLRPQVIVLHFTESDTAASAYSTFAANTPNRGELPGTCAHFIVDQDGLVLAIVPTDLMCRHAIGLNHVAIGIEIVQASHGRGSVWAEQQILARPAQIGAVLALVRQLQARYGIATSDVIGHAMANGHRLFQDRLGWRNDHTDWSAASIATLRSRL